MPTQKISQRSSLAQGTFLGLSAYLIWGLVPVYWPLLQPATPLEILSHRILWSLIFVAALIGLTGKLKATIKVFTTPRLLGLLSIAALLIAINWGVFIWASVSSHILDSSLGYFIGPLISVALGVVFLGERLRKLQWFALSVAAFAVGYLAFAHGSFPYVALILAGSFGLYGYVKKIANVDAIESLAIETLILVPVAMSYLVWLSLNGMNSFFSHGLPHSLWLASSGVVTAVPLLLFGAAAVRIPLTMLGVLQYLGPTMQFIVGIWYFHEPIPQTRLVGFVLTWVALAIFTTDSFRHKTVPSSKVVS